MAYLAFLVVLLVSRKAQFLDIERIPDPIGGIVPIAVPWFGALGGVTISLYGIFDHSLDWQRRFNLWHIARPFVGAILGTMAFLIFIGFIQSTGKAPTLTSPNSSGALITYFVIAFVVGFREKTFRKLIQKVVDTILSPGSDPVPPVGISIDPSPVDFGTVPAGSTKDMILTVTSAGSGNLVVDRSTAMSPGTDVDGGGFSILDNAVAGAVLVHDSLATLKIRFSPTEARSYAGSVIIRSNAGTQRVELVAVG